MKKHAAKRDRLRSQRANKPKAIQPLPKASKLPQRKLITSNPMDALRLALALGQPMDQYRSHESRNIKWWGD